MMAVLGVPTGHSTKTTSDFADVDRRTVQMWVTRFNEDGISGLRDALGRGRVSCARYGRIRRLDDRLADRNMLAPRKLRNWIRDRIHVRYGPCSVRKILHFPRYLEEHDEMEILYLLIATLRPSAVESV